MVLVDSNVLLDWLARDPLWRDWSVGAMRQHERVEGLAINPLIYAEVAAGFSHPRRLDRVLSTKRFHYLPLPYEAAYAASAAFVQYRQRGGEKRSPMPDFYIGAHAMVAGLRLLTRDVGRYRTYFRDLHLITPPSA